MYCDFMLEETASHLALKSVHVSCFFWQFLVEFVNHIAHLNIFLKDVSKLLLVSCSLHIKPSNGKTQNIPELHKLPIYKLLHLNIKLLTCYEL